MNKHNIPAAPDENKIEELLAEIRPVPSNRFHQRMKQAVWRTSSFENQIKSMNNGRVKLALAMTVLLLLAGFLISPQGRAWAQEAFQFFNKVNSTTLPLSDREIELHNSFFTMKESYDLPLVPITIPTLSDEIASLSGCDTDKKAQSYSCQIAYAESQLGFELMEFPANPQGLDFQSLWFDKSTNFAMITYESPGTHVRLSQRIGEAPEEFNLWPWVPASDVEKIKVGPFDGEYVSGFFTLPAGGKELVWNDSMDSQRLAWSDGTTWYLLDVAGFMKRERIMELAASLVASPVIEEKRPDPSVLDIQLTSISEAKAYSGLDLKAPTLLPINFAFTYAHYTALRENEVSLRFDGSNVGSNYMTIRAWKGDSLNFDSLSTAQGNYEIVKVNGQNAIYGSTEGQSPHLFLWWQDGDLNYQMYFYWYTDIIHGVIDKQEMIAIAESMEDINLFKGSARKPFEQVKIYEQALEIDIKEFLTIPDGWSFDGFWAEAWDKCIGLSYTSATDQESLYLTQCGTDRYFATTDVPATAIERAIVGKNMAQYSRGGYDYDSNGIQVWQPDLPAQQLRWKENGLWIHIAVYGNNDLLYDKAEMISIAESLH
jgi:hypothetical protein